MLIFNKYKITKMNLNTEVKSISVKELSERMHSGEKIHVIDVREPYEWEICRIDKTLNIPMSSLTKSIEKIPNSETTVIMCHHGVRSFHVIQYLQTKGFDQLMNLEGGIHAWALEVDEAMARY